MKLSTISMFLFLAFSTQVWAQKTSLEKVHPVTKDDKKGYIQEIDVDQENKTINVVYRINDKRKSVQFHTYTFDLDFNLLGDESEEFAYEMVPKSKQPKKYRGEDLEIEGLYVEGTMMGNVVLKRKVTKLRWSWYYLDYVRNTKVEGKLKIKSENDKKYFYHAHIDFEDEGTSMILGGEKGGNLKDPLGYLFRYDVMKYDIELNKLGEDKIHFEKAHALVQQYSVYADNEYGMEWVLVFAPHKPKRYTGPKVHPESALEYTVVRVSPNARVLERFTFTSPNSIWRIDQIYKSKNGNLLMFGPSNEEDDDYFQTRFEYAEKKFKNYQLGMFDGGNTKFISVTNLEDFEAKMKKAPDGKKGTPYKGKKFVANSASFAPNGDILVTGQQFTPNKGRYEDINIFHFDSNGALKSQYAMNKKYATLALDQQIFEFSADKKHAYWVFLDVVGEQEVQEGDMRILKPLITPKVGKLNLESGEFEGYMEVGNGDYYVHPFVLNYLEYLDGSAVNFLGEDKKGKELWFAKMPIE